MKGGTLVFEMGPKPLERKNKEIQFYTESNAKDFVPVPFVAIENRLFEDNLKVVLGYNNIFPSDKYFIFYCIDSTSWETYEKPFIIDKTCRIYLKLQHRSKERMVYHSQVVWCDFVKKIQRFI